MKNLNPTIELEQHLGSQIYTALQGSVVEEVLRMTKINSSDAYWRSNMEGHCLKVQPDGSGFRHRRVHPTELYAELGVDLLI